MGGEFGQERGLDPGQRGAMEGVRSDRYVAGSVLGAVFLELQVLMNQDRTNLVKRQLETAGLGWS